MRLFRYDSGFWTVTGKIFDLTLLNMLWLLTSLPIITIGAASTALHSVTMRMAYGEEPPIIKSYFGAFLKNGKRATIIWLILLSLVLWLLFGVFVCSDLKNPILRLTVIPESAMLIFCFLAMNYVFPVCAEYCGTVKETLFKAAYLSVWKLHWSVILVFLTIAPILVTILIPNLFPLMLMFWIFLGTAGICYVQAYIFNRVFRAVNQNSDPCRGHKEEKS